MFNLNKQKLILVSLITAIVLSIGGVLCYYQIEYGIFYSRETRKIVSFYLAEKADELIKQANFPETAKMARRAVRHDKENIEAYILWARAFYAQEKLEMARDIYLQGLTKKPDDFRMNFYLGNVCRDLKQFDLAENSYKKALEIEPHNIECWINYALFYGFDKNDKSGAVKVYEEALEINPDNERLKMLYESAKENAQTQ